MPLTENGGQGIVTQTYRSGIKLDGAWRPFAQSCPRMDLRPGDKVSCALDAQGNVVRIEMIERGSGILPPDTISEGQMKVLRKILDDREQTPETLEERFLVPFTGKRLSELSKLEGGLLLDFFFGRRKPAGPRARGFGR